MPPCVISRYLREENFMPETIHTTALKASGLSERQGQKVLNPMHISTPLDAQQFRFDRPIRSVYKPLRTEGIA